MILRDANLEPMDQLDSHQDKWLFLLRYLSQLDDPPTSLQDDPVFDQLFDVAALACLSADEQMTYHNSLKYYRDMNNTVNTARKEGWEEGREVGLQEGREEEKRSLLPRLLQLKLGVVPTEVRDRLTPLSLDQLGILAEQLLSFEAVDQQISYWIS